MKNNPPIPYKHQIQAFNFIEDKDTFALFMDMGTGKSKVGIMKADMLYLHNLIDSVIIISPKAVSSQWIDEQFPTHSTNFLSTFLWEGKTTKKAMSEWNNFVTTQVGLKIFSINIEAFSSTRIVKYVEEMLNLRRCFIIIDESTRIKNGRRKQVKGKRGGAKRTNLILDLFEHVKYKCVMTGTPTPQSPFDLWSQFEFLRPNYFGMNYFMFTKFHGIMIRKTNLNGKDFQIVINLKDYNLVKWRLKHLKERVEASKQPFDVNYRWSFDDDYCYKEIASQCNMSVEDIKYIDQMETYVGYKHLDRLRDHVSKITFYAEKEKCLDLPQKVFQTLYCDMGTWQKKLYNDLKKNMQAEHAGRELTLLNKVSLTLRLQQIAGGLFPFPETEISVGADGEPRYKTTYKHKIIENSCKIKVLLEDLPEVPLETFIIVWAVYRSEIELIVQELRKASYACEAYYGGSDPEIITRFKNKEFRICVMSPLKGGEGLNLQHSSVQYWYSDPWKADLKDQGIARQDRLGQTSSVTIKGLIVRGSVDERIAEVLRGKMDMITFFRTNPSAEIS